MINSCLEIDISYYESKEIITGMENILENTCAINMYFKSDLINDCFKQCIANAKYISWLLHKPRRHEKYVLFRNFLVLCIPWPRGSPWKNYSES